ncbi:MAG: DUF2520 domain-containing protein [Myxococcales bacterium]|nr:DUF2520 domain-containing protein [Myxococcales bacterium]
MSAAPGGEGWVLVLGRGKVGHGLSHALKAAGVPTRLRSARHVRAVDLAGAWVAVLAVPDAAILETSARVAPQLRLHVPLLHCAGGQAATLAQAVSSGHPVGAMHPLVSFADAKHPPTLVGTSFVIAGDAPASAAAKRLAHAVGALSVVRALHGPAYHAAAALVANGATALAALGIELLEALDVPPRDAARAMGALLRSVGENVERLGLPRALTGPVARGDVKSVSAHRRALAAHSRVLAAYDAVAPSILDVAVAAGLAPERARALRRVIRARGAGRDQS